MANIDERVVKMKLDDKDLQAGAQRTTSTLAKLKQAFKFKGAGDGVDKITGKVSKFNMNSMGQAVDSINSKFSGMGVAAATVVNRITNAAMNAGQSLLREFINPISSGFSEYETQMNSVQTIMANTASKGTKIGDVTAALDELNTYADKTIYNFTEMSNNIGTFTAAGVDLKTATSSIKGIANLAAVSGSNSQQASTAMYQLSQAIAAGSVKLQDWNSVVNAGMGGEQFQQALIQTSEHLKTGAKNAIQAKGSFRESLSEGWLTSEVLTQTLDHFALSVDTAEDYNKSMASLVQQGYTQEQAKQILDMAKTAGDAATKIKTFTQLIDTLREAMGSGWAQTWQLVFGDFEEAKESWTTIGDTMSTVIGNMSDQRNNLLKGWAELGGRKELFAGITDSLKMVASWIKPIQEGFREIFPPATAEQLMAITKGLHNFILSATLTEDQANKLKNVTKTLASGLKFVIDSLKLAGEGFGNFLGGVRGVANGFLSLFDGVAHFASAVTGGAKASTVLSDALSFLGSGLSGIGKILGFVGVGFSTLAQSISGVVSTVFQSVGNLTSGSSSLANGIVGIIESAFQMLPHLLGTAISSLGSVIRKILTDIPINEVLTTVNLVIKTLMMANLNGIIGQWKKDSKDAISIGEHIKGFFESFSKIGDSVTGVLDKTKGAISSFAMSIKANILLKIAAAIGILAVSLKLLSDIPIAQLGASLGVLAGGMVIFGAFMLGMLKAMDVMFKGTKNLVRLVILTRQISKLSKSMLVFAVAIRILTDSMTELSKLTWEGLAKGVVGIGAMIAVLIGVSKVISNIKGIGKASLQIIAFGVAMKVMASALQDMGQLGWDELARGLVAFGGSAIVMVGALTVLGKSSKTLLRVSVSMMAFGGAMKIMANALHAMGDLDFKTIAKGVLGFGGMLLVISKFSKSMKGSEVKELLVSAGVLMIYAEAIKAFGDALVGFNDISVKGATTGILGIGAILLMLKKFMKSFDEDDRVGEMGAALLAMGQAIKTFAEGVQIMAKFSWEELAKGMIGVAGGLAVMVKALQELPEEEILAKSSGMVIFGVAMQVMAGALRDLGSLDMFDLAKGLVGMAGTMLIVVAAMTELDSLENMPKVAGSIMLLGLAMAMLTGPIMALGRMKLADLAQGLIGMAAAFAIVGVAAKQLSALQGDILKLAGSMAAMGAATIVLGLGLTAMIYPIEQLGKMGGKNLLTGISGLIAIVATMGILIEGINAMPKISLKAVASLTIMSLVVAGIGAVLKQLAVLDAGSALEAATAMSEVLVAASVSMLLLNAVNPAAALKGIAGLAIVIAGTGAIVAAMGALAQIPGFKWIIGEGKKALASIGEAIGGFFGSIVGGFAGGAMAAVSTFLPLVGTSLSDFYKNAQPFLDGMKGLSGDILGGVKNLAEAVLFITAAGVLNAATSWLTGGNSMEEFGKSLSKFGPYISAFADSVSGIDAGAITASASAAKALAEFAQNIPNSGGLAGFFAGENDIDVWGKKLPAFGKAISEYAISVAGIDAGAVTASATAAKSLAELAKNLPNSGGVAGFFAGENDIDSWGKKLVPFGKNLKEYSEAVDGMKGDAVKASADAGKTLSELASNLPNSGGMGAWFTGDNDIAVWGDKLPAFGKAMSDYSKSIEKGFKPDAVKASASAAKALAELSNNLPNSGGMGSWFTGDNDIAVWGSKLPELGKAIQAYSKSVKDISPDVATKIKASASAMQALASLQKALPAHGAMSEIVNGVQDFQTMSSQLGGLGRAVKSYSESVKDMTPEMKTKIDSSIVVLQAFGKLQSALPGVQGLNSIMTGNQDFSVLSGQLPELGKAVQSYAESVKGLTPETKTVIDASIDSLNSFSKLLNVLPAVGGLNNIMTGFQDFSVLNNGLPGLGRAVISYANSVAGITPETQGIINTSIESLNAFGKLLGTLPAIGGIKSWLDGNPDFSSLTQSLPGLGRGMKSYADSVAGITPETQGIITTSIQSLDAFGKLLGTLPAIGGIKSWFDGNPDLSVLSTALPGLGRAIKSYASSVSGITGDTVTSIDVSIKALQSMAKIQSTLQATGGVKGFFTGDTADAMNALGPSMTSIGKAIANFAASTAGIDGASIDVAISAVRKIKGLAGELTGFDGSGFGAFKTATESAGDLGLHGLSSKITTGANETSTAMQAFRATLVGQTNMIVGTFNSMNTTVNATAGSLGSGVSAGIGRMTGAMTGSTGKIASAAASIANSFSSLPGLLNARLGGAESAIRSKLQSIGNQVSSFNGAYREKGDTLASNIGNGMRSGGNNIGNSMGSALNSALNNVNGYVSKFYDVGTNLAKGLANGITDHRSAAINAAAKMGADAVLAAKKATDEHSPSKLTHQIGVFFAQGMANGIEENIGQATKQAGAMATESLKTMTNTVSKISDTVNGGMDLQPVIRPVLDLDNVQKSAQKIGGILSESTFTIGTSARLAATAGVIRTSQNGSDSSQNKPQEKNAGTKYVFNQYNNSPKALSPTEIYRQTNNQFTSFKEGLDK